MSKNPSWKFEFFNRLVGRTSLPSYRLDGKFHGLDIDANTSSRKVATVLDGFIDKASDRNVNELSLMFLDINELNLDPASWSDIEDPELELRMIEGFECAAHRDFFGIVHRESKVATILIDPEEPDGLYNSLRWVIPPYLLEQEKYLFHSCATVKDGKAMLFIGKSGAGKTTMAGKATCEVLGDDVNLVSWNPNRQLVVESGHFGQNPKFSRKSMQSYPVEAIYSLCQGAELSKDKLSEIDAITQLTASIHCPTWESQPETVTDNILLGIRKLAAKVPIFELTTALNTPFGEILDEL